MAYALEWLSAQFQPCVEFPSWIPTSADNWSFEIDIETSNDITTDQFVIGNETTTSRVWKLYINGGNLGLLHQSNWSASGFVQSSVSANTRYKVRGEFDGSSIRLFFDGAQVASVSGRNLLVRDGVTHLSVSGARSVGSATNALSIGTKIYSAKFYDDAVQAVISRNYTKETLVGSDDTEYTEQANAQHGTLFNHPSDNSQWINYYTTFIHDIGGGSNDYPDLISWGNDRGSSTDLEIAHVYSDQFFTTAFDHRTDFTGGYEVVGMGNNFAGDFSDTGVIKITRDVGYTGWLIDDRTGRGSWQDVVFDSSGGQFQYEVATKKASYTRCGFVNDTSYPYYHNTTGAQPVFIECAFYNSGATGREAFYALGGTVTATSCIVYGAASSFGLFRIRNGAATATDCIAVSTNANAAFAKFGTSAVFNGSGCVSNDASAADLSIGVQDASLPTYFEDLAADDLRINSAGQAALPTSLSWAYSTGGGSVDITITLDSGTYSLSGADVNVLKDSFLVVGSDSYLKEGQPLGLLSQRNLITESGNYSYAGQLIGLLIDRYINLESSNYNYSGNNVNLLYNRSLSFEAGSYTKSGDNVSLIIDRFLSAESGSYTYTGQDVDLSYSQSLTFTLGTGSYTCQGTDQGILKNFLLPVEAGEYTYDASNVTLLADRRLPLQSGEYTKVGNSVNFVYEANGITYTLSLEEGSYLKQGTPLRMLADRLLPVDTGTYLYEGNDSNLLYNRVVALDSGLYSSAGTDLGIKVNRRLQFQNGNYSLTGTPITLSYTGEVLAILEGYSINYKQDAVNDCFYKQDILSIRYK